MAGGRRVAVDPAIRLRLSRKARLQPDPKSGQLALLSPESLLLLNDSGAAIVRLLDGERSVAEICALLAERFASDGTRVTADVSRYLTELLERRLIEPVAAGPA